MRQFGRILNRGFGGRGRFRSTTNPFIRTRSPFVPAPRRRSDVWFSASRWLPQRAQSTS